MVLSAVFTLVFPDDLPRGRVQGEGEQPERGWGLSQGLLVQMWCIQSHGTPGAAPKAAERVGQWLCNATLKHLWKAVETGGGPQQLEKGPYHICPQTGEEWWLGGLQVNHSHIHPCDCIMEHIPGHMREKKVIKTISKADKGQIESEPYNYLVWSIRFMDKWWAGDAIYIDFSKAYNTPQCLWFWARC